MSYLTAHFTLSLVAALLVAASTSTTLADEAKPPRAAQSVHLGYPAPESVAFYNEVSVDRTTPGSYFMVCGFVHGYFGIQEKGKGERVAIFSIWDPTTGDDAKAVPPEQRVEVLHRGEGVEVKRFGGEGTGGQSFFPFDWKTGETYRFFVTATVEGEKTAYAGHLYLPDEKRWKHLVTFRTRTGGDRLRGLYSFVEDFRRDTKSAAEARRATFGNGWVRDPAGAWHPLTKARFTASSSEWEAKETIDAGRANGERFYLQTGGETKTGTKLNSTIERATGAALPKEPPADLPLDGAKKSAE